METSTSTTNQPLTAGRMPPIKERTDTQASWEAIAKTLRQAPLSSAILLARPEQHSSIKDIQELARGRERIFVVDHFIPDSPLHAPIPCGAGYELRENIFLIDHHAPDPRWERAISSGNLACAWVRAHGPCDPQRDLIVINHTDCDSVLASLILMGALPPHPRFEEAVIDSDHRGTPNRIADTILVLSQDRSLSTIVEALARELEGSEQLPDTVARLDRLHSQRMEVRAITSSKAVTRDGGTVLVECDNFIESELFLPFFPDAVAIVIGCPSDKYRGVSYTRIRLGQGAPPGLSLHNLRIKDADPFWGGRFNAGTNKRSLDAHMAAGRSTPTVVTAREHFHHMAFRLRQWHGSAAMGALS